MKQLLTKIAVFLLIVYCAGYLAEMWIGKELSSGKRYYFQADWHDLANHQSEILFVGNSRTWVQVDPFYIQNKFNTSCEIIAQDGQDIQVVWLKLKEYLKHNEAPKEIYLQFDPFFLQQREDLFGIDNIRTCFFFDRVDLSSISDHEGYKSYYRFLPLAAYNWELIEKIRKGETVGEKEKFENTRGAIIQDKVWEGDWIHPEAVEVKKEKFGSHLDSLVMACKTHNIKLYAIFSPQSYPSYQQIAHRELIHAELARMREKSGMDIPFIDFNDPLYNDSTLFYNHMHLNRKGVKIWMDSLVNQPKLFQRFR
ncbi:MAG: hypothetical protein ACOYLH_12890 [Flavobacteriales bacterium]